MLNTPRTTRKPSPFYLFPFTLLLTLLLCLPWVNAQKPANPQPQPWHINGIVAALDDSQDKVKGYAFDKLAQYKPQDLKSALKKPEDIAGKTANILKNKNVNVSVRSSAALALGNLGASAQPYIKDILNFLKDEQVNVYVRGSAAVALGNLGASAQPYIRDILNFLKDEQVNVYVRGSAAVALGNLGETAQPYHKDIADILKDKQADVYVRASAAVALGKLGKATQPYLKDILDFLKDEDVDVYFRGFAAQALGNLGKTTPSYLQDVADILKDEKVNAEVRAFVAQALGNLGEAAQPYLKDILNFLKDRNVDTGIRGFAAESLGNLGASAQLYLKDILDFLKDESVKSYVRRFAASALENLGEAAQPYLQDILNFLRDERVEADIRGSAAIALSNLGEAAQPYISDILNFLKDEQVKPSIRGNAAEAFNNLGASAQPCLKNILNFLKDENIEPSVRGSAAPILGNLGQVTQPDFKDILDFLKDEQVKPSVRSSAAESLGNLGASAQPYIKDILNVLKDEQVKPSVRSSAAEALGNLKEAATPYLKDIADIIQDEKVDAGVRSSSAQALGNLRKLQVYEVVVILNSVYEPNHQNVNFETWRFLAYFFGGGTNDVKTLLKWLGNPQSLPTQFNYEDSKKTLKVLRDAWIGSQGLERLQQDLATKIARVARRASWKPQDIPLLQNHYNNLKKGGYNQADTVHSAIHDVVIGRWLSLAQNIILIHAAFWLALIFAYPKFPHTLAVFFWNPWIRKILGVGYVGFLLTWVPYFRRQLFEPFKPSLLADAELEHFDDDAYFPESNVIIPDSKEIKALTQALPKIQGQIILEGDSGLGKSMFLRHVVANSKRIFVYLPAQKCDKGVIKAIQNKMHGQAQDAGFLKNLIYSGAIDICIDGLNEVSTDTRAKITDFVDRSFRGNIIMTTQPLEWIPPSTTKTYYLQPLESHQIDLFLVSRQPKLLKDAKIQGKYYKNACIRYLANALNLQQPPEELEAAQRILSNPMDLTLVALMLSQGNTPDLFRLQEQQYNQMAEEFWYKWKYEFPLERFSQAVYQMRLNDENTLPAGQFPQELQALADKKYKMVVRRQSWDREGKAQKEWYFRHDKIMDFFLMQNFLGESTEAETRLIDHMGDPRFRGVYTKSGLTLPFLKRTTEAQSSHRRE
ncbi:HEAT repeat domain-containing protein [Allocoleopsis franciscana]|uniref:HEAT repeat-containing protein n=1 Tax=Allocoleopsis franciscana PCC 7113 TaxID=1173027 RepID=K9WH34_9CYAN|nr:HEAT repeat domain-containing protein [Allocoleopsis franciscana]AFZ19069.1 HEAT repeat-containing protein [Allocoleopsis franciscana PCC 7113]